MNGKVLCKILLIVISLVVFSSASLASNMLSKNDAIIEQFQLELKQGLMAAIKKGGPVNAVKVCAVEAPSITARLSEENGVLLKRVSKKNRNPNNTASIDDKKILAYFESNPDGADVFYSEQGKNTSIYARVIRTDSVCLVCHGESISSDVTTALKKYYPKDLATGYKLGDIRGMFTIERALNDEFEIGIKNFKMLNNNLWVGGQPSIKQLEKLKSLGVKTIVNLRPQNEMTFDEAKLAKRLGLAYSTVPIRGADDITFLNSDKLQSTLNEANGPVFLHCSSSNRVGALLALDASKKGKDLETSIAVGRMGGMTSLQEPVSALLARRNP